MPLKLKLPNLQENILFANHTTFRIGGPARYFLISKDENELLAALRAAKESATPFFILGGGSNLLVADEGFDGLVIKVQSSKFKVQNDSNPFVQRTNQDNSSCKIIVEAGTPFTRIILETTKNGYAGVQWGFGIPGTIGGAICGNAGRLGQAISEVVLEVKILDKNLNEKIVPSDKCEFDYRGSRFKKTGEIILEATLVFKKEKQELINKILNEAKEVIKNSPPFPSAGCVFKNYQVGEGDSLLKNHPELSERVRGGKIGVGYLIDQCGLKGKQAGGAKIWEGHANYIINAGGASAKDVLTLIDLCKKEVRKKYEVDLKEEIRYLKME